VILERVSKLVSRHLAVKACLNLYQNVIDAKTTIADHADLVVAKFVREK
jgi:hypothetical protein